MSKTATSDADWAATGRPLGRRRLRLLPGTLEFQKRFQSLTNKGVIVGENYSDRISFLATAETIWRGVNLRCSRFSLWARLPVFLE